MLESAGKVFVSESMPHNTICGWEGVSEATSHMVVKSTYLVCFFCVFIAQFKQCFFVYRLR